MVTRSLSRARARPWSYIHGYAQASPTRPAYGSHKSSSNPAHSNVLRLRNASADLQSNCYSKRLGGMGVNGDCGVDVDDRGGRCCLCSIGPKGPIIVRPEGRTDSRAIGPEGPITVKPVQGLTDLKAEMSTFVPVRSNDGRPECRQQVVHSYTTCTQSTSQQAGTQSKPTECGR